MNVNRNVTINHNKKELIPVFSKLLLILFELLYFDNEEYNSTIRDIENYIRIFLSKQSLKKYRIQRLENYVEEILPSYTNDEFKSHFRMKRSTYNYILNLIKSSLVRSKSGRKTISVERQFLIAIWKMATPDSYRSICEKFNVGRATALKAVRRVTKAIVKLAPIFITWPDNNRVEEIITGFAANNGFPKVIGAIDGTHINIKAPHISPESYVNRKGHYSIQLQAVCDHEQRFLHCLAGHVGSVHDQRVFRLSEIYEYLKDPTKFPNDTHLIGDAAYMLHNHVMTPFRDNGHLTRRQKNFNYCLSSARTVIERAFGLLKGRFRSLLTVLDMERVDLIPEFIIACCVLHNICLLQNDDFPNAEIDIENEHIQLLNERHDNNAGSIKQNKICNSLIMRNM
ncbi:protein ANTAGONIST OF LIKE HETEROCHROMATIN PROTEIN 1-like [Pseudomyrmex gracilis]|uniref:protein ANTAGONIST OF LIKE HETEROCHROMATIN PROTEIN 1-like n=1 Tax=Pseudomyrmex gracilis TaxID=219809 RepID=UPI000994FC49|nr:protein ANTAGONIST OF LIKE HETEROCHROMATIN PROTEIN 1-like [Pseudomyrmex gracilis]